ncbi:hypothetical protein pdam_00015815 [Pocillopora damicornis]|uniref:Uncharacterized protein n=1 Tax=Pocillopora damicornis TaxID=46731 RepID=A0A3M6T5Z5_POCDA|nr:hypothetical protein pdam_00015815 [Pocillopora damicornis]
MYKIINLFSLA